MIESAKIKFHRFIEWSAKSMKRRLLMSWVFITLTIAFGIAIHELGHIISANLLGYETYLVANLTNNKIEVIILELDHDSLDPLLIGLSGGYLTTAIFIPMGYFSSRISKTWFFSHNAKLMLTLCSIMFITLAIYQFVYGTLEGISLQTNWISMRTGNHVGNIVGSICFVIMLVNEFVETDKILNRDIYEWKSRT